MVNRLTRRSGDDVPVIGAGESGSGGGDAPARARSPRLGRGVALVVAAALAVTAIITLVGDEGSDPNPTDVSLALPPPVEPSVATTAPKPEPPEFALGWKELGLPGWSGVPALGALIDGGPSGWVAVTQGNFAQLVHTSRDGVGWRTTTLDEGGWVPTVFSGEQGLFVAVSGGPGGAGIWRSVDAGIGWERSVVPGDGPVVVSVTEAAGEVWAAGMAGNADIWSTGTPAVWVLEGEDWVPVALEGERGWVASVVEWEGGVWGFGSDVGPVVWDLSSGERVAVSPGTGLGGFRSVVAHQGALWGLFTATLTEPGRLLTASDPTGWGPAPALGQPSGLTLEPMDEQLAVVGSSRVDLMPGTPIPTRISGYTTGRETASEVAGLAVLGEQAVMLGRSTTSEAMLWARGTLAQPIVLLDPDRMYWGARRELGANVWGPTVVWDERIFLLGERGVYEWVFGTDLIEVPGGGGASLLLPSEAGLLALSQRPGGGLLFLEQDEFVEVATLPSSNPCGAAFVDGVLTVADCEGGVYERAIDGEWSRLEAIAYPIVGALDGAFLAYDPKTGELGVTVDGSTLEYRGQIVSGYYGQDPFAVLERRRDSATVRLIEPWPGGATFEVPTPSPIDVTLVGNTVRVQSPSTLYVSTDQGRSWTEVPVGVENGFPEGGILLPTEALMVIAPNPDGSGSILYTPRS